MLYVMLSQSKCSDSLTMLSISFLYVSIGKMPFDNRVSLNLGQGPSSFAKLLLMLLISNIELLQKFDELSCSHYH